MIITIHVLARAGCSVDTPPHSKEEKRKWQWRYDSHSQINAIADTPMRVRNITAAMTNRMAASINIGFNTYHHHVYISWPIAQDLPPRRRVVIYLHDDTHFLHHLIVALELVCTV